MSGGPGSDAFVFSTKLGNGNIDRDRGPSRSASMPSGCHTAVSSRSCTVGSARRRTTSTAGAKAVRRGRLSIACYAAKRGVLVYDKNGSGKGGEQVVAKLSQDTDLHQQRLLRREGSGRPPRPDHGASGLTPPGCRPEIVDVGERRPGDDEVAERREERRSRRCRRAAPRGRGPARGRGRACRA